MRILQGKEEEKAFEYLNEAAKIALNATCLRSRCGSVIVKDNRIIGKGFNSPPADKESQRRCEVDKKELHFKITDKTCCVHAEQRAIMDALKKHPDEIKGSRLYFARLKNSQLTRSDNPYCTICSKMALEAGIAEFVLWHEKGVTVYNTEEYNNLSYLYKELGQNL